MKNDVTILLPNTLFTLLLLLLIANTSSQHDQGRYGVDVSKIESSSSCFNVKGVPTFRLRCNNRDLIKTEQAFYGAPPDNRTCAYNHKEQHCVQMTELREQCMGRSVCSVYSSNPFLINCHDYATYKQVNYSCIPRPRVHDICASFSMKTHRGFIRSPRYPDAAYPAGQHCACRLQTNDRAILLQMLDFSLAHTSAHGSVCQADFLKISGWGKKCGTIGPQRLPEKLELETHHLTLQFHSDSRKQARGFWLEFTGSAGGEVSMTCGKVNQHQDSELVEQINGKNVISKDKKGKDYPSTDDSTDNFSEYDYNNIIIDDGEEYVVLPTKSYKDPKKQHPNEISKTHKESMEGDLFDTYDFAENQEFFQADVTQVQIVTGCVVGGLILAAVLIIIILVFRR